MVSEQRLDREGFAAAAWTTIVEPGDELAGLLRLTLGADEALQALINRQTASAIANRVLDTQHRDLALARFGKLTSSLEDGLERWLPRLSKTKVESALKVASACGARFIHPEDEAWPSALSDLGLGMPAGLWVRGQLSQLTPALAIVGSRTATPYGAWVCAEFVGTLHERGVAVVSGGAFGIDAAAHESAVNLGAPNFAVMAGGVDQFYPSSNSDLLRKVAELGAVFSELPPGARPTRWRFLQRNRIIAALGRATLVVEAGHRSGAINTANHALSIGRPVGALPGQVNRSTSDGCHRLIRDSLATLISSPSDLLELIGLAAEPNPVAESMGALELRALDALTLRFQDQHAVLNKSGLTSLELAIALGGLELAALAERNEQGFWRKRLSL
ncbi:MAG: DNA-processing protein DprA [Rhodoluna sp.]|nr:DNA-processing protein DprA [Rhodoluna sp.]